MTQVLERRGFTFHDMAHADHEEVVADFYLNGGISSGVAFARKQHCSGKGSPGKDSARGRILNWYDSYKWPMPLRILTMPGLKWRFELQLLQRRGRLPGCQTMGVKFPKAKTIITAIERDEMIYRGSLKYIPRHQGATMELVSARAVKTNLIHRYIAMDTEEYIEHDLCPFFDAAWLDFNGFLTERRLEGIRHFWNLRCGLHLTVTTLAARWPRSITTKMQRAGGLGNLIAETLDAEIFNEFTYADGGILMHQVSVQKKNPSMAYFGYDRYPIQTIKNLLRGVHE